MQYYNSKERRSKGSPSTRLVCAIIVASISIAMMPGRAFAQDDEKSLRKIIANNPDDYIAITKLGVICQEKVKKKEAITLFRRAVSINPDYPPPHLFLGRLYFLMQRYNDAVNELDAFRQKSKLAGEMDAQSKSGYIANLHYAGDIYFTLRQYGKAKEAIDEALRLDPSNQMALYNLGVYYYACEHSRSGAYSSFTRAIAVDGSSDIAKKARFAVDFIRENPDSRIAPNISFLNDDNRL